MKKSFTRISAAVASLALAGTCFAAPAMADTTSGQLFGSLPSGQATEPAPQPDPEPSTGCTGAVLGGDVQSMLEALGITEEDLEAFTNGDLGITIDPSEVREELEDLTEELLEKAAEVEAYVDQVVESIAVQFAAFMAQHLATSEPVDLASMGGGTAVAGEPMVVDGLSFVLPEGYDVQVVDIAQTISESSLSDAQANALIALGADGVVTVAVSGDGQAAISTVSTDMATQLEALDVPMPEESFADFVAQMTDMNSFVFEGVSVGGGKAILCDGTEAFMLIYTNSDADDADELAGMVVLMVPTSDTTIASMSVALTGAATPQDTQAARDVLSTLALAE